MGQSLHVDPEELRNTADELRALADETARAVAELKADLAREGACWGNDEPGKTFAESYVPGADQSMTGFENLVQNVEAMSSNLRSTAESFENQDRDAANDVRDSIPDAGSPGAPGTGYAPRTDQSNRADAPDRRSQSAEQAPEQAARSGSGSPAAGDSGTGAQQHAAQRPADSPAGSDSPGSEYGDGSNGPGSDGGQSTSRPETSGPNPSTPVAPTPSSSASTPLPSASSPGSDRGAGTRVTATPNAQAPSGRNVSGTASPGSPGAPGSKPGTGTSPVQQSPPRISPPRRPAAPKPPPEPKQRKAAVPAPPPRPVTDDEAMRIVTAMAVRHNLQITGFETSGLSAQTAQEIADVVDSVLTKYSIALHGIEIADSGGELSGVENRAEPATPEPEPWIVLDRRAVADPGVLSGLDRIRARPVENAPRPMHTRMLREFGHVADLVGGFRARSTVQRALITEYLRITGAEGRTLSQVVDGYRRWRDQLGEHCFRDGVLDSGRALAEGFATVEQGGIQAPGPARVLHRLLLVMARLDMR